MRLRYLAPFILAGLGVAGAWALAGSGNLEPGDIAAHAGQTITVTGTVSEVFTDRRSGVTFIDMGGAYPNNAFTAVIFPEAADRFPDASSLDGRTVKIAGLVRLYRDKPEIILRSPKQIQSR
jgi:DNA/RNA endonuclease YhcR with UshA esterase domain